MILQSAGMDLEHLVYRGRDMRTVSENQTNCYKNRKRSWNRLNYTHYTLGVLPQKINVYSKDCCLVT